MTKTTATTRSRRPVAAIVCAIWMTYGAVRVAAWVAGHPGDAISLTSAIIAGVAGFIGLAAFLLGRHR